MGSSRRGKSNKKKAWKKVQLSDVNDFLYGESLKVPDNSISQSNIEKLYEIATSPSLPQIKNRNDLTSYSYRALKHIAPNSYVAPSQNYVSSEDENPINNEQNLKKNLISSKNYGSVIVSEDIWANGSVSTKRKNKTNRSLPEFKLHPPSSGLSYNPDFKEYEKYVNNAAAFDLIKEKRPLTFQNEPKKNCAGTNIDEDKNAFVVAMAGDYHVSNETETQYDNDCVVPVLPNRMKAKSKKEKLRKKLHVKNVLEQSRIKSIEKKYRKDIQQLRSIHSTVRADESALAERRKLRKRKINIRGKRELLKKTLPPVSEIPLPEELNGSLRTVKPTISILDNKAHHIRESKLIVKRNKKSLNKPSFRKVYGISNKIIQDLN